MIITRKSMLTGKERSMDLPITEDDLTAWRGGRLIQDVFPQLTPDQREFIMTGITSNEWETLKEIE